jgi:hypothetical protein
VYAITVFSIMLIVSQAAGKRSDLDGVWILLRSQTGKFQLTPEGEKKRAAYDFQKDDPDFQCKPASITRVMHTPSPPIEVRQRADHIEINYEFMDVKRRVPLKLANNATVPYAVTGHPHLGRSIGAYDGETLVIETTNVQAGILDTLGAPGLYQSERMRTVERWTPKGDNMEVVITHEDPVHFLQPWTATYSYLRLPGGKIEAWDCKPEEATFERFLPEKK